MYVDMSAYRICGAPILTAASVELLTETNPPTLPHEATPTRPTPFVGTPTSCGFGGMMST
jgi:hypothetical protein